MKREFLQLAHTYIPSKYGIGGWYASRKCDGMRCFWDGGITRGMAKAQVLWANKAKDSRYITPPIATGLWSRYGNVIHAPNWWLDRLPAIPLDGELWIPDYTKRQDIFSIIKNTSPDPETWNPVEYHVFDTPYLDTVFADGEINTTNFKIMFSGIMEWLHQWGALNNLTWFAYRALPFETALFCMNKYVQPGRPVVVMNQFKLPMQTEAAIEQMNILLSTELEKGGEGLVLRSPFSAWTPGRVHTLLKVKPFDDAEGTVIGYTTGRETDKGSKLLGMIGALVLRLENGREMELSGLTDSERFIDDLPARSWAVDFPGKRIPEHMHVSTKFPLGKVVTFKYRGESKDGIPQEARYDRERIPE